MKKLFYALIALTTLVACSNYVYDLRGKFDDSLRKYNSYYRWNDLDTANAFVTDSLKQDARQRAQTAKKVRIVDSRIVSTAYDEIRRKAIVEVEVDYYVLSTTKVKTLRDTQEWAYKDEQGIQGWRLMSLMPEFK